MGRKSVKDNKNVYQTSREEMGLTRARAAEELFISEDRIEKIEGEKTLPRPEEILAMSKVYKNPSLCNYYCSKVCPIGQEYVPEVKVKDLAQITLEMLASLNAINKEKDRLIEITADGVITDEERADFERIQKQLSQISIAVDSLELWVQKTLAEDK